MKNGSMVRLPKLSAGPRTAIAAAVADQLAAAGLAVCAEMRHI